jgi:cation:H+ antiporter
MIWLQFVLSAAIVVLAAIKLAEYGDIIAVRTRLSGMFIGTLLLAGATSLPELLSALNALNIQVPNLAAGSIFGSSMFNMLVLALLDLLYQQARVLRRVAMNHALTASLAILLMGLVGFFLLAGQDVSIGWIGLDSLIIIVVYAGGVRLIQNQGGKPPTELPPDDRKIPSLRMAVLGFTFITIILVIVTPSLVESADQIATLTGLSTGFIGATLLAFVTSLPEVVATVAAVRIGAFDLAVGNLFGSNLFNMFAVGFVDVLYFDGLFLSVIDQRFAVVGLLGLVLTCLGLIGNIARVERRLLFVELDAFLILMVYFLGMWFLYSQGVGV